MVKVRLCRALALLGLMAMMPVQAEEDRSGSSDYVSLKRFPLSHIVDYEQREVPEYRWILGGLQKVNGVIRPEQEERHKGRLTRITYGIPDQHGSEEPFNHFRKQLEQQGAEILFACEGRDCGSSNYWANAIFSYSKLYGLDTHQHYLAARLGGAHYALYSVVRGNRRVYTHLEVLESDQVDLVQGLRVQGFVKVPMDGTLSDALINFLNENTALQLWVVAFDRQPGSIEAGISRSEGAAAEVRQNLITRGIGGDRIHLKGVGALAPLMLGEGETAIYLIKE